jgi:hypothetical protein
MYLTVSSYAPWEPPLALGILFTTFNEPPFRGMSKSFTPERPYLRMTTSKHGNGPKKELPQVDLVYILACTKHTYYVLD